MRRVKIKGTPPQDWVAEADAVTAALRAAAAVSLAPNDYTLQLHPALQQENQLPAAGTSLLAIGAFKGSIRLRAFNAAGAEIAYVKEGKKEPVHSPIHDMRQLLHGNWDVAQLKPLEKGQVFKIATAIIQRAKIDAIIEDNEDLWTDDRIRNWLLDQFNKKCWYAEAQDSVSSIHVDHYRPKGQVSDDLTDKTSDGYWWQAFKWNNYKMCGQLINVKKKDVFPFADGTRGTPTDLTSLDKESPILIDPCTEEARFISFELEAADSCIATEASDLQADEEDRATRTIEILGLNRLPRLNSKRAEFWNRCKMQIDSYKAAKGPQCMKLVAQAAARAELKKMVTYDAEFSSVAEACIRKRAPEALIASVFSGD